MEYGKLTKLAPVTVKKAVTKISSKKVYTDEELVDSSNNIIFLILEIKKKNDLHSCNSFI